MSAGTLRTGSAENLAYRKGVINVITNNMIVVLPLPTYAARTEFEYTIQVDLSVGSRHHNSINVRLIPINTAAQ